ncbi:MAG: DUF4386 domain-containing protein [Planctomycetota bacterium]|jgi:hypothetical protein
MTNCTTEASPRVYARVAGLAYILVIVIGALGVGLLIESNIVPGDDAATVKNIRANELLFRIGVAGEVVMFVLVVLLSLALYVILETVDRNLALLALLWRVGEAIIGGGVAVISGLIPLLLLNRGASLEAEQLQTLVGLFLDVGNAGLDVVLIFIGVGGTVFCYLFFKSRYVPRILAAWGMLTYLSMLVVAVVSILTPNLPETIKMVVYAPGGLFELVFGLWLLVKGVNVEQWKKHVLESA